MATPTYTAISPFTHVVTGEALPVTDQWPDSRVAQFGYDEAKSDYYLAGIRHNGQWVYIDPRNAN